MKINFNVKRVLIAVLIPVIGFVLLNLTFLLYALYANLFFKLSPPQYDSPLKWVPVLRSFLFIIIIAVLTALILKSKLNEIIKAVYLEVPAAICLVTEGMYLYRWPVLSGIVGALIYAAFIFIIYKKKKPWFYYYSASFVAAVCLIILITGTDI